MKKGGNFACKGVIMPRGDQNQSTPISQSGYILDMLQPEPWSTSTHVHDTSHASSVKLEKAKWMNLGK